jgi:hypothetical protein
VKTLYTFIGEASHRDSPDSLNSIIVIAADTPGALKVEALEDYTEDVTVLYIDRVEMDSIHRSIETDNDGHGFPEGEILDLTEPYILGWGE